METVSDKAIETLATAMRASARTIVLTGAGCSTGSGIGDYRDRDGEWKRAAPVQHADFMRSMAWRQRYWARSQRGFPEFARARPNTAHRALAALEGAGLVAGVITQNVDGLHQQAGQRQVIDLHGNLHQVVCMACASRSARMDWQVWLEQCNSFVGEDHFDVAPDGDADLARDDFTDVQVPECRACGGVLKPDVVFYGDGVPAERVAQAFEWVDEADLLLIVGSSLMVYSGFRFARRAHARGIPVYALNQGRTRADDLLAGKLDGDCMDVLSRLAASLNVGMDMPEPG